MNKYETNEKVSDTGGREGVEGNTKRILCPCRYSHLAVNIHSTNDQEDEKYGEVAASNGSHVLAWDEWFWLPFEGLRSKRIVDVEKDYLLTYEYVNNFTQENLQTMNQIITEEGSRLRISLRDDDFIVSDYEDEIASLIACPSLSWCIHGSLQGFLDKDQDSKQTVDPTTLSFAYMQMLSVTSENTAVHQS